MSSLAYPEAVVPSEGINPADTVAVITPYEDALEALATELVLVVSIEIYLPSQLSS